MKILFIAPYTTNNDIPLLSQCVSGFGYMSYDISKYVARKTDSEMLLFNYRYKSFDIDKIHFVGCQWQNIISNIFHCASILTLLKLIFSYQMSFRTFIRVVYYWLISGYYSKVIRDGLYDVVHVHQCGFFDTFLQEILERNKQKYLITLHGLNSFSDSIKMEPGGKKYEKDFLRKAVDGSFPITVISSGIKKTILDYFKKEKADSISIVNNSFAFDNTNARYLDVREKYSIPKNAKILLYVGNLSYNKNQMAVIKNYDKLPQELKDNLFVLFCGRDLGDNGVVEAIEKHPARKHLIICGNIPKEEIGYFYAQSDAVALLSIAEGFGLSLIEGLNYGLPCVASTSIDAFEDIYFEEGVIGVNVNDDDSIVKGITELLTRLWDNDVIKMNSIKFSAEKMVENYINVYKNI